MLDGYLNPAWDDGGGISEEELEDLADRLYDEYAHDERSLSSTISAYRKAAQNLRRA